MMKNNKQTKVFILTAIHDNLDSTKRLLKSIRGQSYDNFEIVLVDDGSTDGTSAFIKNHFPDINLYVGNGKLWWTKSLNIGLKIILDKAKKYDFIWIINNDCFFDSKVLENLVSYSKNIKQKNIVGSVVIDSKTKKVWDTGVQIDWRNCEFKSISDIEKCDDGEIDALSTKGTLYPVQVFKEIGNFDAKHFPQYFSDYEFSIRAKRNGYKLCVCPTSRIYNFTSNTGIGDKINKKTKISDIFNLLFSKKSKVNIKVVINIIRYVCPKEYRIRNYYLLIKKTFKYI